MAVLLTRVCQEVSPRTGFSVNADLLAVVANDRVAIALEYAPTDAVAIELRFTATP